jgi:hypothetical protein
MPFIQNIFYTSMTTQNKIVFAGLIMVATMLSISVTYNTAFAQVSDVSTDRPIHPHTVFGGVGAAVSEDGEGKRSYFRMGIVPVTDSETEFEVKRGTFMVGGINHDNREKYSVIADSWQITVSADKASFDASGQAENEDGEIYDVSISGDKISDLENGDLYYVTGTATGDDGEVHDLFYISVIKERIRSADTTS